MLLGSALHIGGAERVIANLARSIDRLRFRVTVAHLKEQGAIGKELADRGLDVVGIPRVTRGMWRYLSFRSLSRVLEERSVDLVHTHTTYSLADAALCRLVLNRRISLVHTFHYGNYPRYPTRYKLLERGACRIADRLVAVGHEQRDVIGSTYALPDWRISTIVNGVDEPRGEPDGSWRGKLLCEGHFIIGTICVCSEQKGLDDFLAAASIICARFDQVRFVIVGDGPTRGEMERRTEALGLAERVVFTGWRDNAGATMLPMFDVFFQTSLWEAMSMVVLEAMAAGKPVVATDVGDNRHVIVNGVTGFVVPRRDHAAMVESLSALVTSSTLALTMGAAARSRHQEHYTTATMARDYEALYIDALAGSRRP